MSPQTFQSLLVAVALVIIAVLFVPTRLNDHPKTHCINKSDNTGGYYSDCTDPTYVSFYTKYISKNY